MDVRRVLLRTVYWLAVLVASLALVLALVLFFESLDDSSVDSGGVVPALPLSLGG
jgi:hypothetical protein